MSNNSSELATFRMMANDGWLDSMYWLASGLLISDNSSDRGVEAAKWLFIAIYLGHERSKGPLEFVNSTLGTERFNQAYDDAIAWLEEKFTDFDTDKDISKWSPELYQLVKKSDDENKRRAAIKLVWRKD